MSEKKNKKKSNIKKIIIAVVTAIIIVYIGIRIESKISNNNSGMENMPTIYPHPQVKKQAEDSKEPKYNEDDGKSRELTQ